MNYLENLIERHPVLKDNKVQIDNAYKLLFNCFKNGNKLLICGNGGSSADSGHIMGELMKRFNKDRKLNDDFKKQLRNVIEKAVSGLVFDDQDLKYNEMIKNLEQGLPTIDLTAFNPLNTAYVNDKDDKYVFANSVLGLGKEEDVLLVITTSGNSINVVNACAVAKAKKMKIISLTGRDGGKVKNISDVSIIVPFKDTYLIQEEHLSIYHALCLQLEEDIF